MVTASPMEAFNMPEKNRKHEKQKSFEREPLDPFYIIFNKIEIEGVILVARSLTKV